jgi:hypothetical protein
MTVVVSGPQPQMQMVRDPECALPGGQLSLDLLAGQPCGVDVEASEPTGWRVHGAYPSRIAVLVVQAEAQT